MIEELRRGEIMLSNKTIETFKQDNVNVMNQVEAIILSGEQQGIDTFNAYKNDINFLLFAMDLHNTGHLFYKLGMAFKDGKDGISKDNIKATKYFTKAAGLMHRGCALEMIEIMPMHDTWYEEFKITANALEDNKLEQETVGLYIYNIFKDGFDDEALAGIEEFTNPHLVYKVAQSFKKGLNGFQQSKELYVKYLLIAAGYLHDDATYGLHKIGKEFLPKESSWNFLMDLIDFFEL